MKAHVFRDHFTIMSFIIATNNKVNLADLNGMHSISKCSEIQFQKKIRGTYLL